MARPGQCNGPVGQPTTCLGVRPPSGVRLDHQDSQLFYAAPATWPGSPPRHEQAQALRGRFTLRASGSCFLDHIDAKSVAGVAKALADVAYSFGGCASGATPAEVSNDWSRASMSDLGRGPRVGALQLRTALKAFCEPRRQHDVDDIGDGYFVRAQSWSTRGEGHPAMGCAPAWTMRSSPARCASRREVPPTASTTGNTSKPSRTASRGGNVKDTSSTVPPSPVSCVRLLDRPGGTPTSSQALIWVRSISSKRPRTSRLGSSAVDRRRRC